MTAADFRRIALGLPEAAEGAHMGKADFRVRGKVFATLGWPDPRWGMVKLTPDQQEVVVASEPDIFVPVKGTWGKRGATQVRLSSADGATLNSALTSAWRNVAPKTLAKSLA
jgi:hypothetical protein